MTSGDLTKDEAWNLQLQARIQRLEEWSPIDTAPRDGSHILACWDRYGPHWTFDQAPPCVVHWWANPGEEGFYNSLGDTEEPLDVKFWKPLGAPPTHPSGSATTISNETGK